jgi:ABC-2 type transport system permease protein
LNNLALVFEVARWEFKRFFKIKDVIITLLILLFLMGVLVAGGWLAQRGSNVKPKIAVINSAILRLDSTAPSNFDFSFHQLENEIALRERVGRQDLDGLLIIKTTDSAELVTYKDPFWLRQLENVLTNARRQIRLAELNLEPKEFEMLMAPFLIVPSYHAAGSAPSSMAQRVYAGIFASLMLLAIFACYQYLFNSITGEKNLRVTEQIISAISPQVWMDGKILGISVIGLAFIIVYGSFSLIIGGLVLYLSGFNVLQLVTLTNPLQTVLLLTIALLGILIWNCFFAAIAATVDDPNTSSKSVIMFAPFLPVLVTIAGFTNPDSFVMRLLSIFPFTSPSALSMRLVVTEVPAWEIALAIVLLIGTIWLLRKAAARIFRIGMLIYGKEASLAEVSKWLLYS